MGQQAAATEAEADALRAEVELQRSYGAEQAALSAYALTAAESLGQELEALQARLVAAEAEALALREAHLALQGERAQLQEQHEAALEAALDARIVAGAGLDVAPAEPPPPGAPILRLAVRPDVVVTPHVAWASAEAMRALADQVTANIEAFLTGG